MTDGAKLNGGLTDELSLARRAALIRKFAAGHRLNAGELTEIADIIPSTAFVVRRVTSASYKLTLREYAEQFIKLGMEPQKDNERKLKSWTKHGRVDRHGEPRDPPDLPPFDAPDQLASWWRRCMVNRPPDWMVSAEKDAALTAGAPSSTPPPSAQSPPVAGDKAPPHGAPSDQITGYGDLDIQIEGEIANDFAVRLLYAAAKDNMRRYEEARARGDMRAARIIREELFGDVKALQRAQVDALKVLAARGDYLRSRETMQALNALLAMQDTSFYNALEEAIHKANPQMEPEQRRDLALEFRDKVFEHFHRTDFAEAWTPQEHAA